jgi:hypothetical protein
MVTPSQSYSFCKSLGSCAARRAICEVLGSTAGAPTRPIGKTPRNASHTVTPGTCRWDDNGDRYYGIGEMSRAELDEALSVRPAIVLFGGPEPAARRAVRHLPSLPLDRVVYQDVMWSEDRFYIRYEQLFGAEWKGIFTTGFRGARPTGSR